MHPVKIFIIAFNTEDDLCGFLHRWFINSDRLETTLQCRIFLNILAVFCKSCCANHLNFSAGKGRLQNIGSIHTALCITCTHQIMNFINEQDNISLLPNFINQAFNTALKLSAKLRACNQRCQIQQENFLLLQMCRHISVCNPQSQPFGYCSLADTRFPNQAGIIFRAAGKDLDDTADFLITANHMVHFAGFCLCRQVRAIRIQMPALRLGSVGPAPFLFLR